MKPVLICPWQLDSIKPDPRFAQMNRSQLAEAIQYLYQTTYGHAPEQYLGGMCLHWCYIACVVLRTAGMRAILQAGTMHWVLSNDPNAAATHFSYEWDPEHPASKERIAQGALPELHCWVALPDLGEIVDFSTVDFKKWATIKHGLTWTASEPPEYLWCKAKELPENVYYKADLEAIKFVFAFLSAKALEEQQAYATPH